MMMNAAKINWARTGDALPAFLAIAIMPLTYSIGELWHKRSPNAVTEGLPDSAGS